MCGEVDLEQCLSHLVHLGKGSMVFMCNGSVLVDFDLPSLGLLRPDPCSFDGDGLMLGQESEVADAC